MLRKKAPAADRHLKGVLELALAYGNHYNLIHEIKQALPILDAIRRYLPGLSIQQRGRKHWACCPLHSEKTPSFVIYSQLDKWYCFGCHRGGDTIDLISEALGQSLQETIQILASDLGLQQAAAISEEAKNQRREKARLQRELTQRTEQHRERIQAAYNRLCAIYKATFTITGNLKTEKDLERPELSIAFELQMLIPYLLDELESDDMARQYAALERAKELIE